MNQDQNNLTVEESTPPARNLAVERLQIASPAIAIVVIFALASLIQVLVHYLILATAPAVAENDWYPWVVSMVPMYGIAMPVSLLLFRLGKAEPPQRQKLHPLVLVGLLTVCFGLTYAGSFLGTFVNLILGILTGQEIPNQLQQLTQSSPLWVNLLFCGILAPILEEIFYRKLVIDRLRRYGDLPAILLSGIAFGLIHGNFSQFFYATLIGMLFGYIYLNTGNIRYTILLHMALNMVGGVYATEVIKRLDVALLAENFFKAVQQNPTGVLMYVIYVAFVLLMCVAAIVSAILLILYWRKPLRRAEHPLTRGEWCRVLLLNPGVWLFVAIVILRFL